MLFEIFFNHVQSILHSLLGHLRKVCVLHVRLDLNGAVFVEKLVKLKGCEPLSPLDFLAINFNGRLIFPELVYAVLSNDLIVGLLVSLVVEIAEVEVFGKLFGQVKATIDCRNNARNEGKHPENISLEELFANLVNVLLLFFVKIFLGFGLIDIVSVPANTAQGEHLKICFDMKKESGFDHMGPVNHQLSCLVVILSLPAMLVFQHILLENVAEKDLRNEL